MTVNAKRSRNALAIIEAHKGAMRRLLLASLVFLTPVSAHADAVLHRVMVRTEALRVGLPPELADAVAQVESGYRPNAIGTVGEIGLMQVRPSTARMMGFSGTNEDLADPATNIRYGVRYLHGAWKLADGDVCTSVMKYRAGHGESRFSHLSVAYCLRVRAILAQQGYPVRGSVPKATFGAPVPSGAVARAKGKRTPSRIDWAAHDRRIRAIQSQLPASSLSIMQ